VTTDTGETFVPILQKHCGSKLFLAGIVLYAAGNILTMLIGYGLLGILPLLFLSLPVIGLVQVYLESKHKGKPRNTQRIVQFFKICTIIILVLLGLNALFSVDAMFRGGNFAALSGFYSLLFSIPVIVYLAFLLRMIRDIGQKLKENAPWEMWQSMQKSGQSKLKGVFPITIFGLAAAVLEFLHAGLFTAFAQGLIFDFIYLTRGIADFGLAPAPLGFWFGFISAAGAIVFIAALHRLNRDLGKHEQEAVSES